MPSHGTETCAVVEAVVSLAAAGAIIGDPALFERAERVAYNALPAAMTKNMWERVYLQASNEAAAAHQDPHIWITGAFPQATRPPTTTTLTHTLTSHLALAPKTDGPDGGTYSLEGN